MKPARAVVLGAVAAALSWAAATAALPSGPEKVAPPTAPLLDVPYVPQSGVLCGGAALAMVLRFWGETGVLAEDFAALVEPGLPGIRAGALVDAVVARGWTAVPRAGTPAEVEAHLARGRPVIVLIGTGAESYHYVVVVAWTDGQVIVHDPDVGPWRGRREDDFVAAWSASGNWSLLILPPPAIPSRGLPDIPAVTASSSAAPEPCGALMEAGIILARRGDAVAAEREFLAAQSLCPSSAGPLRERAGLRFRAQDWAGTRRLAARALALDPGDDHSRRLLAGSCFLAGDVEGALGVWNQLSEPRLDVTRIDGLSRIRFAAVADQLDLPAGGLLTPRDFRQASRRLAEMPAQSEFRLSLRPLPDGAARVEVTLLERPLVSAGPWGAGRAGLRALLDREVVLDVASPTGNGELWTAGWRWWRERPRVSLALLVPAAGGRPGIWGVEGYRERQTYASRTPTKVTSEERRRATLSFADWLGPDLRLEVSAALDEWTERGTYLAAAVGLETRWARDRVALSVKTGRWLGFENRIPFGTASTSLAWSSSGLAKRDAWQGCLGLSSTTSAAPLALWSGAGTGYGRDPLLRAHPLLYEGVVAGRAFGRTLVHGTIERQVWPWTLGPLRVGWAFFVDTAKPWDTGRAGGNPWQVDGGLGLRLRSLGRTGQLRIDVAHGFADGNAAMSVAWELP